jgi:hypothetical protein
MPQPHWAGRIPDTTSDGGGATTLTELTDVTGDPAPGYSPVADETATVFPLTRVTTQDDLDAILAAVAQVIWNEVTLYNGCTAYGGDWAPPRYRHTLNNVVHVEGLVMPPRPLTDTDSGIAIAQIPVGPGADLMFTSSCDGPTSCRLVVKADGLILFDGLHAGAGEASLFSLSGISYSVDGPSQIITAALTATFGGTQ